MPSGHFLKNPENTANPLIIKVFPRFICFPVLSDFTLFLNIKWTPIGHLTFVSNLVEPISIIFFSSFMLI